jgi:hypothetical protein
MKEVGRLRARRPHEWLYRNRGYFGRHVAAAPGCPQDKPLGSGRACRSAHRSRQSRWPSRPAARTRPSPRPGARRETGHRLASGSRIPGHPCRASRCHTRRHPGTSESGSERERGRTRGRRRAVRGAYFLVRSISQAARHRRCRWNRSRPGVAPSRRNCGSRNRAELS